MTDYEYDENLPYVVEQDGRPVARVADYEYIKGLPYVVVTGGGNVLARFTRLEDAEHYVGGVHFLRIIDTTPKPRVPDDAKFITWLVNGSARWFAERKIGSWAADGATYDLLEDLPGVTPSTEFTVLDARDERKNR